jgi:hypothetical protein
MAGCSLLPAAVSELIGWRHRTLMRNIIAIIAVSLLLAGCSDSSKRLDSGTAISGLVWKRSLRSTVGENSAARIPQDAKVDVYDGILIIHLADGSRQVVPLDFVSDLKIK